MLFFFFFLFFFVAVFVVVVVVFFFCLFVFVVVLYIFWSFGTVGFDTFSWKQSFGQPGTRRRGGCRICHYLSLTDTVKPSLLF